MNPRFDSNAGLRSVAIVGAGFAGRAVARKLDSAPADMGVIDRDDYNCLQPLPIAWPCLAAVHIFLPIGSVIASPCFSLGSARGSRAGPRLITGEERRGRMPPKFFRFLRNSPRGAR
jgi:hypothetical protein